MIRDDAEGRAQLDGALARAGDALAEALQDARAHRMRQGLGDPRLWAPPGPSLDDSLRLADMLST